MNTSNNEKCANDIADSLAGYVAEGREMPLGLVNELMRAVFRERGIIIPETEQPSKAE